MPYQPSSLHRGRFRSLQFGISVEKIHATVLPVLKQRLTALKIEHGRRLEIDDELQLVDLPPRHVDPDHVLEDLPQPQILDERLDRPADYSHSPSFLIFAQSTNSSTEVWFCVTCP